MTVVAIDGTRVSPEEARVSVFDRGFLYGEGVFELIRSYDGALFAVDEHLDRLALGLDALGIAWPCPRAQLHDELALVAREVGSASVRVVVTRGEGAGLDPRHVTSRSRRVVVATPFAGRDATLDRGLSLASVRAARPTDGTSAAGAKVSSYLGSILALQEARARGADEAAMVDADGAIVEGHASNLFVVHGGVLRTPPLALGLLRGVTRQLVLELAPTLGLSVEERVLFSRDFWHADEAFLTSSLREVVPVVALDGRPVGLGQPGPWSRRVLDAYQTLVRARVAR